MGVFGMCVLLFVCVWLFVFVFVCVCKVYLAEDNRLNCVLRKHRYIIILIQNLHHDPVNTLETHIHTHTQYRDREQGLKAK